MQVEHVFIMWGSNPSCSAEIKVPGLGTVKINDVISNETRAIIEKEAILALQIKLGMTCSNLKEEQNANTNIQGREDESKCSKGNGEATTKEERKES